MIERFTNQIPAEQKNLVEILICIYIFFLITLTTMSVCRLNSIVVEEFDGELQKWNKYLICGEKNIKKIEHDQYFFIFTWDY